MPEIYKLTIDYQKSLITNEIAIQINTTLSSLKLIKKVLNFIDLILY